MLAGAPAALQQQACRILIRLAPAEDRVQRALVEHRPERLVRYLIPHVPVGATRKPLNMSPASSERKLRHNSINSQCFCSICLS